MYISHLDNIFKQCIDHRDHGNQIFGVANIQSYDAKDPESLAYESISLKEAQFSTIRQHVNSAVEDDVNMEKNPSYLAVVCNDPQEKPATEDKMNPSYLDVFCSNPQEKPATEDKVNMEEKYAYVTVK